MQLVAPSILSANFGNLDKDISMLNGCADIIHLDIMDGRFVPNISFGFPVIEAVSKLAKIPMDAHFMVTGPEDWVERTSALGVKMFSFHQEAAGRKSLQIIKDIQAHGMKAGLAINPDIPLERLFPYIGKVDYFLLMSVFAGFGGQKFIYETLDRVSALKAEMTKRGAVVPIEVDGGVNEGNAAALYEAGAEILVAGSAVFKADDPAKAVEKLRNPQ